MLCRLENNIQTIPNSNQNKHDRKLRVRWKFWIRVGRRYYIVNVVDYITNKEFENLEILVEEFTAEEFQIIEENKYKLSSCLLQEILGTTDVNVDWWANKKATKLTTCETFYLQEVWCVKHGNVLAGTSACWMCCVGNLLASKWVSEWVSQQISK